MYFRYNFQFWQGLQMKTAILLKMFTKTSKLLKVLIEIYYTVIANYSINLSWLYQCTQDVKTHKKACTVILIHSAALGGWNCPAVIVLIHILLSLTYTLGRENVNEHWFIIERCKFIKKNHLTVVFLHVTFSFGFKVLEAR